MTNNDLIKTKGTVIETLHDSTFKVKLESNQVIAAYASGKIRKNSISILVGDEVTVEMSPYDLNRGRIISQSH
ncbi:translation initiation factor IF-1 [Streptomyces noursei]|uniref:translation initiation factor IF-1 n=1 Tax=Streptomyces noursei TaxID=1971 RepID=UPI0035DEC7AF